MSSRPQTTLEAIDEAIEATQGSAPGRAHYGASTAADPCDDKLWYQFRWVKTIRHSARLLRLFNRGQREENELNAWLRMAGLEVWAEDPDTNEQWRIDDVAGHFGGSLDGVVMGLPEAPREPHVSEQKTHNKKSYDDLLKKGVQNSKPVHYGQMQIYMYKMGIQWALYQAICKDDDRLYLERVPLDEQYAKNLVERSARIIASDRQPRKLSEDPTWYQCRFCDYSDICHGRELPEVNCRTCAHSTPVTEPGGFGRWVCELRKVELSVEDQRQSCDLHIYIPTLLRNWATPIDANKVSVTYRNDITNNEFTNGPPGYRSKELRKAPNLEFIGDPVLNELKAEFHAEIE